MIKKFPNTRSKRYEPFIDFRMLLASVYWISSCACTIDFPFFARSSESRARQLFKSKFSFNYLFQMSKVTTLNEWHGWLKKLMSWIIIRKLWSWLTAWEDSWCCTCSNQKHRSGRTSTSGKTLFTMGLYMKCKGGTWTPRILKFGEFLRVLGKF